VNTQLVKFLDTIADYYIVSRDLPRSHSFRSAARNIELLSFEISEDKLSHIQFKGLGKSTIEEIKQFLKTGSSSRLDQLKQNNITLSLLRQCSLLYDFDLQYIDHLYKNFKIQSIQDLSSLKEERVLAAIDRWKKPTPHIQVPDHSLKLIGDCSVHSAYSSGHHSIDDLAAKLTDLGDKHIFISDFYQGDNVLSGLNESRFASRLQSIKQAQIDYNIKIFQGTIIDLDVDGKILCPSSIIKQSDFVTIKLSTRPHFDVISRVANALKSLPKESTMIDLLDRYASSLDQQQLQQLIHHFNPIVLINPETLNVEYSYLKALKIQRIALGSNANDFNQLDTIHRVGDLIYALGYSDHQIINCIAQPFKLQASTSINRIGTR
jgi:histidinol phosphatase-like PHP family hydrolase